MCHQWGIDKEHLITLVTVANILTHANYDDVVISQAVSFEVNHLRCTLQHPLKRHQTIASLKDAHLDVLEELESQAQ
eukprot:COSAG02_NODE_5320_length_4439_cov_7.110599_2_plen_77_part_00